MSKTAGKITATVILVFILVMAVVFAAVSYPDAALGFSGMTMQDGANGKVQGFMDLDLKNVNATSVGFVINYDKNFIVPSDYATNGDPVVLSSFFVQNTDLFPEGSLNVKVEDFDTNDDDTLGSFYVQITPNEDASFPIEDAGGYIEEYTDHEGKVGRQIMADGGSGLNLGKLSFRLVDPAGISQMSQAELNKIFYVEEDSAEVGFYDNVNDWWEEKIISYDWDIQITLISVQPVTSAIKVLAPDIYNSANVTEPKQDLIDYLNMNHKRVLLKWSNGVYTLDDMTWDLSKCTIGGDEYDRKGGTYTVTQAYNADFDKVNVVVEVESVTLLDFYFDNKSITYDTANLPADMDDLDLPEAATPVLDKVVYRYALDDRGFVGAWQAPTGFDFSNLQAGTYIFTNEVDISLLSDEAPWLTIKASYPVEAERIIGEKTPAPIVINATVDRITGVQTITVQLSDKSDIATSTTFKIKFPNGYILDSTTDIVTTAIAGSTATITVTTTDLTDTIQNSIQSMINLGSDSFALSATAPDKGESDFTGFTSPKRVNYYTQDEVVDYSSGSGKSGMFTVSAGTDLDDITTHINLVDSSVIHIAYDGLTGQQPAEMKEVYVEDWSIEGDASATALPSTAGETVTLVGTMKETLYTNHGIVTNEDGRTLTLIITTSDKTLTPTNEAIKVTTNETKYYEQVVNEEHDFIFDKKQVGYLSAQVQTFTIHNIGTEDIEGLNVQISNTDFILVSAPDPMLGQGGKTTFRISTKTGLAADTYEATVTVGSNGNTALETFKIIFVVTNNAVFKVTVTENDSTLGDARVLGGAYYEVGENVTILATEAPLCDFLYWECADLPDVDGSTDPNPTFTMPNRDVTIVGWFEETIQGKLRLTDLRVKNPDDTDNALRDAASPHPVIAFSPDDVLNYVVIVPNATDRSKIWVKPRYLEIDGTDIQLTIDKDGTPVNPDPTLDPVDGYYKTELFGLNVGDNICEITQTYGGESRTYTVNIIRKSLSVTLANGNSPFGLIAADTRADFDKAVARAYFEEHLSYESGKAPAGAVTTATQKYYADAWIDKDRNPDMNAAALFVYSGYAFVDPGFTGDLFDSQGKYVDPANVTRTIKAVSVNDTATTVVDKLTDTSALAPIVDTIIGGGQSCQINTFAKYPNARPGIYEIVYSFTEEDGIENAFSRPLVLLYEKGDADVTRAVDMTDYDNIYNRMKNGISAEVITNPVDWCAVYAYRILDVNSDRNVNSIDANNIKSKIDAGGSFTQFYEKLPESLTE